MLHILLLILKIIGIVLLCILGLLLLGIACALFVPVRYRIEAVRREGEGEPPVVVTVKVTWLLHFVNVLVRFNGSLSARACLLFITVFRLPKKEKRGGRDKTDGKKRKKRRKEEAREPDQPKGGETERKAGTAAESKTAETTVTAHRKEAEKTPEEEGNGKTVEERNVEIQQTGKERMSAEAAEGDEREAAREGDAESDKKPGFLDKLRTVPDILRRIFAKIKDIFENIQYTIQNICDKIRSVLDNIVYYRGVIEGETFQRSYALCKKELRAIVKSLKPNKFEAAFVVGTDDPASTGEILAVCGMLYPILGPQVNVVGDFERKRLEGRVFIKGKLRLFTFIRVAVRIYFNKDIRKLYGLLKKEAV